MSAADVITAIAVGTCISGVGIALVYAILGFINRRTDLQRAQGKPLVTRSPMWSGFLDWLTGFVLGVKRLDHAPNYSCGIAAILLVSGMFLAVGPTPVSAISGIADRTQIVVSACMFAGSGTCLYGISMGTPFDLWRRLVAVKRRLCRQSPASPFDLRRAYRVAASGTPSVVVSMGYYAVLVGRNNPALAGEAVFLGFLALGMFFQFLRFLMEIRRINQTLVMLIGHEITRQEIADAIDGEPR